MTVKSVFLLIFLSCLICGCGSFSSVPESNQPFASDIKISDLEGTYQNLGEGSKGAKPYYLSSFVFSKSKTPHNLIETIEVKQSSEDSLLVQAKTKGKLLESKEFKLERDFSIKNGRIRIADQSDWSFAHPAGNPFIGYTSETTSLGVDKSGNGKLQIQGFLVGTAFVIVPAVMSDLEEIRFRKITPK